MNKLKLITLVAAATLMSGCGGSDDTNQVAEENSKITLPSGEILENPIASIPKPITDPQANVQTKSWVNLSPESIGVTAQNPGTRDALQKKNLKATEIASPKFDGLLVNVEEDFEKNRSAVLAALDAGLPVVLDSSGSAVAQSRIKKLSLEIASTGIEAAAVLLYKGAPDDSISLLAFGNEASEREILADLIKSVGRRDSDRKSSK